MSTIIPENLSPHFTLAEATKSDTAERLGISNTPTFLVLATMKCTANSLEVVRTSLASLPLHINSWYRCVALNRTLGSKDSSQHIIGEAVDFTCPAYGDPVAIAQHLAVNSHLLNFDQLILEHSWVHISFKSSPSALPRRQVLSLLAAGSYAQGLTNKSGDRYE